MDDSPTPRPLSNRDRLLRRFRQRHPSFAEALAQRDALAGWGDNPWHEETAANAQATAIAQKYIDAFTEEMKEWGVLPFCGTELNFKFLAPIADQMPQRAEMAAQVWHALLKKQHADFYPPATPLPRADHKLSTKSMMHGRIYVDGVMLEVATPPMSPQANIARVNNWKRVMFEASHDYRQLFERHGQGEPPRSLMAQYMAGQLGDFDITFLPRASKRLYEPVGPDTYEVAGEHFNWSLVERRRDPMLDYHNAKDNLARFARANLMYEDQWKKLTLWIFERLLPSDALMVYGSPHIFDMLRPVSTENKPQKYFFNHKIDRDQICISQGKTDDDDVRHLYPAARIELRSFHNGASNITLSTLAVLAGFRAILVEIAKDPDLKRKIETGNFSITEQESYRIIHQVTHNNPHGFGLPANMEQTEKLFGRSNTMAMLHGYALDHAQSRGEFDQMQQEFATLRRACIERARRLDQSNHR